MSKLISDKYNQWAKECEARFQKLKSNEEELNRIFINIYGLQDELMPEVEDKDVTVRRADLQREIKSLLSYCRGLSVSGGIRWMKKGCAMPAVNGMQASTRPSSP